MEDAADLGAFCWGDQTTATFRGAVGASTGVGRDSSTSCARGGRLEHLTLHPHGPVPSAWRLQTSSGAFSPSQRDTAGGTVTWSPLVPVGSCVPQTLPVIEGNQSPCVSTRGAAGDPGGLRLGTEVCPCVRGEFRQEEIRRGREGAGVAHCPVLGVGTPGFPRSGGRGRDPCALSHPSLLGSCRLHQ